MALSLKAAVAASSQALGEPSEIVGGESATAPRFELFHAANSICSQKVRTVLAHKRIPYVSHQMNIFTGETYLPDHVRLRMLGCGALGLPLVSGHSGSTSVAGGGCDPAVVPTLVDWETGRVLVDSRRICDMLDQVGDPAERLRPPGLDAGIDSELAVIDDLPNYQMLAGRPPGEDRRPAHRRGSNGVDFARQKVKRCDDYLARSEGDETLTLAYRAKRAKELDAAERLFSPTAMRDAYAHVGAACRALDETLSARRTRWLFSDRPSMADLFWGLELIRIKNMAAASIWEDAGLHGVQAFLEQAEQLPSIRAAVLDWPGAIY